MFVLGCSFYGFPFWACITFYFVFENQNEWSDKKIMKHFLWLCVLVISRTCLSRTSEFTLELPECQRIPCSKQAQNLKFKWLQLDRTHNHLVHKRTLNYSANQAKWLSCVVSTYLHSAFDCMFLSCHIRVA